MSNLKIFASTIEQKTIQQVYNLAKQKGFEDCKIRIMPDAHPGEGCVIGFTADFKDKIIPGIVGVDIACGMLVVELGKVDIDYERLDQTIRKYVPIGKGFNECINHPFERMKELYCYKNIKDKAGIEANLGTLGGGNHFIEIDEDDEKMKYLIIHTGSRKLGAKVAEYYQDLAISSTKGKNVLNSAQEVFIEKRKKQGNLKELPKDILNFKKEFIAPRESIPDEFCYVEGENTRKYLHDMKICQEYADLNRNIIADLIIKNYGFQKNGKRFTTVHNYIDLESNIIRKGAVSAKKDELLLIPINMKEGCLLCKGKGNVDWNESAPHGAGRLLSRSAAKEFLTMEKYRKDMEFVWTSSVSENTLDESPGAYKDMGEIINDITETVEVLKILKSVYNLKPSEARIDYPALKKQEKIRKEKMKNEK